MKGQHLARVERLEAAKRFSGPIKTKEEITAEVEAEHEKMRQALIDGTYKRPTFEYDGLLTVEQQEACWDAWLMDIPEYAPHLKKHNA